MAIIPRRERYSLRIVDKETGKTEIKVFSSLTAIDEFLKKKYGKQYNANKWEVEE